MNNIHVRIVVVLMVLVTGFASIAEAHAATIQTRYTAKCSGLEVGTEYVVVAELTDRSSGTVVKSSNGSSLKNKAKFTATSEAMDVGLKFSIDRDAFAGRTLLVKARLYSGGKLVNTISDGSRAEDRIVVPKSKKSNSAKDSKNNSTTKPTSGTATKPTRESTTKPTSESSREEQSGDGDNESVERAGSKGASASDSPTIKSETTMDGATGTSEAKARMNTVIVDKVRFNGLEKGAKYTLVTEVVDSNTGKKICKGAREKKTITAAGRSHTETVEVAFDASELAGKEGVAFAELYDGDTLLASSDDLSEAPRTMEFVKWERSSDNDNGYDNDNRGGGSKAKSDQGQEPTELLRARNRVIASVLAISNDIINRI